MDEPIQIITEVIDRLAGFEGLPDGLWSEFLAPEIMDALTVRGYEIVKMRTPDSPKTDD